LDPIGPTNPVLDALRKQLAENIERLRKSGKLAGGGRAAAAPQPGPAAAEGLETVLRRRLSALDRRTGEGRAAAARIFVESALVAEFGAALLSDPAFGAMVAEIGDSLQQDPGTRERLERLLAEL
jgi:hypothetical protein